MQKKAPLSLVLNCGSSSLKFAIVDVAARKILMNGLIECLGTKLDAAFEYRNGSVTAKGTLGPQDHFGALRHLLNYLTVNTSYAPHLTMIGHRVLHGGPELVAPALINGATIDAIKRYAIFGPLHNPANLSGIEAAQKAFPQLPQVAVFDTAFHQTMPDYAYSYALPYELSQKHKLRKYGFHGTSHHFVSQEVLRVLKRPVKGSAMVIAHLGNGCSVSAVKDGKCLDTSMGLTPLEGLMMGTRSGDLDPSLADYLIKNLNYTTDEVNTLLNKKSGLFGVSGISSDMRSIIAACKDGDKRAKLAFNMFCYRVAKYVASYAVPLKGLPLLVFTGGIGENSREARAGIMQWLEGIGFKLDAKRNQTNGKTSKGVITTPRCKQMAIIVPTNEELMIALETKEVVAKLLAARSTPRQDVKLKAAKLKGSTSLA